MKLANLIKRGTPLLYLMVGGVVACRSADKVAHSVPKRNETISGFYSSTEYTKEVLVLLNHIRQDNGLNPLRPNKLLSITAHNHSMAMAEQNFVGHCDPVTQSESSERAKANGYRTNTGENVASGQATPEKVVQRWMASSGHRANILNPDYTEIGIGYVFDPNDEGNVSDVGDDCQRGDSSGPYMHYWTQVFGLAKV